MIQDDKNSVEQTTDGGSHDSANQAGGKLPVCIKVHAADLAGKVGKIEKEIARVSVTLKEEAKTVILDAEDMAKHPGRYAELGASFAEGMAGESLGEMLGAGLGTVIGPEGTVIGAEVGGLVGEVFGARQGDKMATKLLHQHGTEHPLKEDLQQESSAKVGGHAGKIIGGMIGDALFDDAGDEIGEAMGDKIGKFVGNLAYKHVEKMHIKKNDEPPSGAVSQTNTDESLD